MLFSLSTTKMLPKGLLHTAGMLCEVILEVVVLIRFCKFEALLIVSYKTSGNHAAALALAAKLRGIPAYIVIPKNAPTCKVENVKRYGGQVIWSDASMQSREDTAKKVLQETGAILIHPYNDGRILRSNVEYFIIV